MTLNSHFALNIACFPSGIVVKFAQLYASTVSSKMCGRNDEVRIRNELQR